LDVILMTFYCFQTATHTRLSVQLLTDIQANTILDS